jgi:hypothetical protein
MRFICLARGQHMNIHKNCRTAIAFLLLIGSFGIASAQYGRGYGPSNQQQAPGDPAHWGYQDGFNDGSHDRATGHSFRPTHDSAYKHAPEYGHPPINRDEYKNIYREAYVRGYQKGYGR